jgi:hypothetical chaperone protein
MTEHRVVGLDFGTTNSAVAIARPGEAPLLASFKDRARSTTSFRSILYFPVKERGPTSKQVKALAGPEAISAYLESETKGRLMVSIKSYLASRRFTNTSIYGRNYELEELISIIIRNLRAAAVEQFDFPATKAVVGRPVHFAGADGEESELLALNRLRRATELAGFEEIEFELEPIAAAYQYERQLDHDELVLIGDFGGGTSDFTLMHLGPGRRTAADPRAGVLGTEGVPVAGDAFDSATMMHMVAPKLGMGSHYNSLGKKLSVPVWIYSQLSSWHQMSFLRDPKTMNVLREVKNQASEPKKIEALIDIISNNLGYELYRAVEKTKLELTTNEKAPFRFNQSLVMIEDCVERWQFESWIQEYRAQIDICVTRLLTACNVSVKDVDSVFLTGGSSLVPVVRRMFAGRFGANRLRSGEELTTVAKGLALAALERL